MKPFSVFVIVMVVFGGSLSSQPANADAPLLNCPNCEVYAEVNDQHMETFVNSVQSISSLPMQVERVEWFPGSGRSVMHIIIEPTFAARHELTSFDLAKKLEPFIKGENAILNYLSARMDVEGGGFRPFGPSGRVIRDADPCDYEIRCDNRDDAHSSNVGTIGH